MLFRRGRVKFLHSCDGRALFPFFPNGLQGHAAQLTEEGFTIDTKGKVPKVNNLREALFVSGRAFEINRPRGNLMAKSEA